MFAALSTQQDVIADKLNLFVALAPIARMKDINEKALEWGAGIGASFIKTAMNHGINEIFGPSW